MICAQEYDPKDTISWSDGPECRQCGKLSGYHMKLHLTTPHQQNQPHISACWHLPKQESISAEMATHSIIHLGTFKLEGVFPITDSRMWPCKPSLPNDVHPHIQRAYAQMHQEFSTMIPPATNPNIPEWVDLQITGINCGSLEKKLHQLYCYLILGMPDIVCLQETWALMPEGWLNGLPYQHVASNPYKGGGLVILVHTRRLSKKKWKTDVRKHSLCAHINPGLPTSIAVASVHFPPGICPISREEHSKAVASFLSNAKATITFIQGDLNDDVMRSKRGWLKKTLSKEWKEFNCPYATGHPTNQVLTKKGLSEKEIDWMFTHNSTPCVACTRDQLPGLSSHRVQQYFLVMDSDQMKPADPSQRRYDFRHLNQKEFQEIANICSLLFAWANITEWSPTAVMHMYFLVMDCIIPRRKSHLSLTVADAKAMAAALQAHDGRNSVAVTQWWENRNNKAMASKLHIPLEKLQGVSITSATTHAIKLKKNKFQVVDQISANGKYFPQEKEEFQEEMLRQAKELYSGRPGIRLDYEHLKKGMKLDTDQPEDTVDFIAHMNRLQRTRTGLPIDDAAGQTPNFHELTALVGRSSSEATSLEQLPHALVSLLDGFSLLLISTLLAAFANGSHCPLLCAVLHLCLKKKKPSWLIPNSRPILLEPYLRRLESSNVFLRQQERSEWFQWTPPSHYAHRKQLSPQMCAITCRWLTWWYAHTNGKVFIIDWDESNAFCNTIRHGMDKLFPREALQVERWAEQFFGSFRIYVVSPFGLTEPYCMRHGGSQGDSMGVGLYATTTCARTRFHNGVLSQQRNPSDLSSRAPEHAFKCLPAPWNSSIKVLEIVYSDDRRGFTSTLEDAAHMFHVFSQGCWSTGGSSQCKKVQIFGVEPKNPRELKYIEDTVDTMQDKFNLQCSGLKMTGIPLMPNEQPQTAIDKFTTRLKVLQGSLGRLQPSLILVLRILVTYTISLVDYVFSAIPARAEQVQPQQIQIKRIACKTLCIPVRTPNKMLWASIDDLGFAVPHIFTRLQLQYIKGLFSACNSRSTYTRETIRTIMLYPSQQVPTHPDWITAQQWMASYGISFHLPYDFTESPIAIEVIHSPRGGIILMSDGAKKEDDHAWSALVIDEQGVAIRAYSKVLCKGGSSWVAEWCGKFLAYLLLEKYDINPHQVLGAISDNLAAMHGGDGGKPSKCAWIDGYRRQYATFLSENHVPEFYIPAQHNTKSKTQVALWQKDTDDTAKHALTNAIAGQVPMPESLDDTMLCFHHGTLAANVVHVLDEAYNSSLRPDFHLGDSKSKVIWRRGVTQGKYTNEGLTVAYWIRTIPYCHEGTKEEFSCAFCRSLDTGWGIHMQWSCLILPMLCMWSFTEVARHLAALGHTVEWKSPAHFATHQEGEQQEWGLVPDFLIENADQWSALSTCITWSGIVLRSKEASLSTEEAVTLSAKYLNGLGRRRRWPPLIRRENLLKESDPVGWPVLSPQWNLCVIAAAYNFVGRSAQPHQEALNPVPLNLLPPSLNPTSFHACIACPRTEHDPRAVYISMMSPQNEQIRTSMITFRATDDLYIMFSRELLISLAPKLTLVLLQDEWPCNPHDQQHDPEPPPPNWDEVSSSASESAPESILESDDSEYWDSE